MDITEAKRLFRLLKRGNAFAQWDLFVLRPFSSTRTHARHKKQDESTRLYVKMCVFRTNFNPDK